MSLHTFHLTPLKQTITHIFFISIIFSHNQDDYNHWYLSENIFKNKFLNSTKYTTPMGAGDETLFLWNQNQWIHRSTKCVGGEKVCICWHTLKKIKVGDQTTCLPLYNTFPSFTSHQINNAFGLVWVCKQVCRMLTFKSSLFSLRLLRQWK